MEMKFNECWDDVLKICQGNNMTFRFETDRFPIVAIVEAEIVYMNQIKMDLRGMGETEQSNGKIQFIFDDELRIKMDKKMNVSEKIFNKIKNNIKKLHYLYLQVFFYSYMKNREEHKQQQAQMDYLNLLADEIINKNKSENIGKEGIE